MKWSHLSLLPVVEVAVVATISTSSGVHVRAHLRVAGVVLVREAGEAMSGWLVWSRNRPYRDFRDTLRQHYKEAGA